MSKRKAQAKPEAASAGPGTEFCYGVAKNLQGIVTLLPIVVKRGDRKALLHGIDEDGNLIGPYEGKRLLKALGIQTWLQASTLTPLKDKEKDRSTFWQRSLLLAVSASIIEKDAGHKILLSANYQCLIICRFVRETKKRTASDTAHSAKMHTKGSWWNWMSLSSQPWSKLVNC